MLVALKLTHVLCHHVAAVAAWTASAAHLSAGGCVCHQATALGLARLFVAGGVLLGLQVTVGTRSPDCVSRKVILINGEFQPRLTFTQGDWVEVRSA
jgi:hypothetical protein